VSRGPAFTRTTGTSRSPGRSRFHIPPFTGGFPPRRKIQLQERRDDDEESRHHNNINVPDVLLSSSPCRNHQAIIISFVDKDSTSAGSNNMLPVVTFHDVVLILDFE
jgi:hypothetical protein